MKGVFIQTFTSTVLCDKCLWKISTSSYNLYLFVFALKNVEINKSENVNLYLQSALTCKKTLYSKVSHNKIQTEPFVTSP